jgi:phosphatidylglycerophosphatase A
MAEAAMWRVHVSTWFGAGCLRPAPGTWGSLAAALIALAIVPLCSADTFRWIMLAAVILVTALGVWCAPAAAAHYGVEDPSQVVIDEVAGTWLAIALLPTSALAAPLLGIAVALVLFRVFDIAKPWPISWCEHLPGGWGIMADDIVAGALAGLLAAALLG